MRILFTLSLFLTAWTITTTGRAEEKSSPNASQSSAAGESQVESALKSLDDRVFDLEAFSLMQYMRLSGFLINRVEGIQFVPNADDSSNKTKVYPFLLRFGLNVDAKISKNLKFYSRIGVSKLYNTPYESSATGNNQAYQEAFGGSYLHQSWALYLDRAYFDYHLPVVPLVLSAGRLPTGNGPPMNLYDGRPRDASYPRMLYNANIDGVALTLSLNKLLPKGHNLKLRAIYAPVGAFDNARPYTQLVSNGTPLPSNKPIYSGMLDYSWPTNKILGGGNLILQMVDAQFSAIRASDLPVPITGEYKLKTMIFTAYLEMRDIGHLGLDLVTSYTNSRYTGTNDLIIQGTNKKMPGFFDGTAVGDAFLASLRFQIPIVSINRPFIGGEYIRSSDGFNIPDNAADDFSHFYSTRGVAFHFYYTQPLTPGLLARFGYRQQNIFEDDGVLVDSNSVNERIRTVYLNLRADF